MEYPEHRFNSDGFCKDCGVSNARATDKFCDGDDDPGAYIDDSHPAYGPTVAGYLEGIQYLAKINKTPFNFDLFRKGLKGGAKDIAMKCSFHSLSKSTMRLTIPYSHRHLLPVFADSLHREVLLHVANVDMVIMIMPNAKVSGAGTASAGLPG